MFEHILVATDGSELSQKAVASAIDLAQQHHAELVIFTVVPHYPKSYFEGAVLFSNEDIARIERQWVDSAQTMLEAAATAARERQVAVRTAFAHSDRVAEAIIAAAKKHGSDLVVMASHGRKGVARLLLGSETLHVLTHASVPVLVLR